MLLKSESVTWIRGVKSCRRRAAHPSMLRWYASRIQVKYPLAGTRKLPLCTFAHVSSMPMPHPPGPAALAEGGGWGTRGPPIQKERYQVRKGEKVAGGEHPPGPAARSAGPSAHRAADTRKLRFYTSAHISSRPGRPTRGTQVKGRAEQRKP